MTPSNIERMFRMSICVWRRCTGKVYAKTVNTPFYVKCFRIEWVAYDLHSGVESLYWRIFDNYTGTDILHGHENLVTQRAVVSKIKTDILLVHEN